MENKNHKSYSIHPFSPRKEGSSVSSHFPLAITLFHYVMCKMQKMQKNVTMQNLVQMKL